MYHVSDVRTISHLIHMAKTKNFKDLNLSNAFLFAVAMQDEETCRIVLETVLDKEIGKVKVNVEHTILYSSDIRSVRLDVYARDAVEVDYDIEMQNEDEKNLPKRSRYYQAQMDIARLKPNETYRNLQSNYVIFLCTFDPFGHQLYRYTYEMCCKETGEPLEDGAYRIFLNTKGKNAGDVPTQLVNLLGYLEHSTDDYVEEHSDVSLQRLHEKVTELKHDREWEGRYMTVGELIDSKGRQEGVKMQERIGKLFCLMNADGRLEEFADAAEKPELFEELFTEYGLESD